MAISKRIVAATCGAFALSLNGCGSSGIADKGDNPDAHIRPSSMPTTSVLTTEASEAPVEPTAPTTTVTTAASSTTTTTTTATSDDPCAHVDVVPVGDDTPEGKLVDELNWRYMSFDKHDRTSPNGVTIRMVGPDTRDDARFYCGTECHGGYPDCRVSSSLYNNKMMVTHKKRHVAVTMKRHSGLIYNQTSIETIMGKCAYMYDGATFGRVNHGCGCAAKRGGCGPEDSGYGNQDCVYTDRAHRSGLRPETCHNNTESSPDVDRCWCKTKSRDHDTPRPKHTTTESQQCFFRGGGIYPPHGSFPHELHEFVNARIRNQENPPTEALNDGSTRYKIEYWNEFVIEGEELRNMLNENPKHALFALMYTTGAHDGKVKAQHMQQQIYYEYGGPMLPIVEMDPHIDTRCSGPFRKARDMPTTVTTTTSTTWDGHSCAEAWAQCGGGNWNGPTCCKGNLKCVADNGFYSACKSDFESFTV